MLSPVTLPLHQHYVSTAKCDLT